jgi:XTP/dITP diphosphohydrolase
MSPKGTNGFGYDPIFIVDGFSRTMAELDDLEKNDVSHRAMAIRKASDALIVEGV